MSAPPVRELRRQVRTWRRGRADARLVDVLGDAYIAAFATLMLGSILVNVVLGLRRTSEQGCLSAACTGARALTPYLAAVAVLTAVLAVARLVGPVVVSPAAASWLVPTPLARTALLRPLLLATMLVAAALGAAVTALAAALSDWPFAGGAVLVACTALLALAVVGATARAQSLTPGRPAATVVAVVSSVPALLLWAGLLFVALDAAEGVAAPRVTAVVALLPVAVAGLLAVAAVVVGVRALGRLYLRDVARGARLAPGLSGALAGLDLALAFDVVVAHRWQGHAPVRSRRARRGPRAGAAALARADLVRVLRSPRPLLVLGAAVVLPYAASSAGAGRAVALVAPLACFVAGLPLLTGLRVLERAPSIARLLPFPTPVARTAALVVPGAAMLVFGLAVAPAVGDALHAAPGSGLIIGVAVGGSGAAAAVRWVTGRPPDYSKPLVSTPAGGVPTNLYGSAVRGLDILVVTAAPLLLTDTGLGVELSLAASGVVLAFLLGRP